MITTRSGVLALVLVLVLGSGLLTILTMQDQALDRSLAYGACMGEHIAFLYRQTALTMRILEAGGRPDRETDARARAQSEASCEKLRE